MHAAPGALSVPQVAFYSFFMITYLGPHQVLFLRFRGYPIRTRTHLEPLQNSRCILKVIAEYAWNNTQRLVIGYEDFVVVLQNRAIKQKTSEMFPQSATLQRVGEPLHLAFKGSDVLRIQQY